MSKDIGSSSVSQSPGYEPPTDPLSTTNFLHWSKLLTTMHETKNLDDFRRCMARCEGF